MKFKIGDRVRVNVSNPKHSWLMPLQGQEGTILRAYSCANPDKGCYHVTGMEYVMSEDDIELVTTKFNHVYYEGGGYVMHIKTAEQAKIFNRYFKWYVGRDYSCVGGFDFMQGRHDVCFNLWRSTHSSAEYYERKGYTILEFEDFDWSDFMKKEFTKADLKNGDVILFVNDNVGIAIPSVNAVVFGGGQKCLNDVTMADIAAVRRPNTPNECSLYAFRDYNRYGELVYEREEVEEMTLEEVCKALGKEIKIVKK